MREAEVGELGAAVGGEQQVLRLQITVADAHRVPVVGLRLG